MLNVKLFNVQAGHHLDAKSIKIRGEAALDLYLFRPKLNENFKLSKIFNVERNK